MYYSDPMTLDLTPAASFEAVPSFMRDMPETDRPRERLRQIGAQALTEAELIAILLRTGSARESALAQAQMLVNRFGGPAGLARASFSELMTFHGIGEAKAAQIKAALELGIRMARTVAVQRRRVTNASDIAEMMMAEMSLYEQEHLRVAMLDSRLTIMGITETYVGTVDAVHVRVAEVLREPIRANSPRIVLLHNHPSGDARPSAADIDLTKRLYEACGVFGIELLDHVVIGGGQMTSMQHMRAGFPSDGSGPKLPLPPRTLDETPGEAVVARQGLGGKNASGGGSMPVSTQ